MNQEWIKVAREDELADGDTLRITVEGAHICLYCLSGRIYATQDLCSHGYASLADGYIAGENIECPMHGGAFHIPTGRAVQLPCTESIAIYPVRTESGTIFIGKPNVGGK